MIYFAYGSNMSTARLEARIGTVRVVGIGCLAGFELRFHKRGRDGTGKCDAFARSDPGFPVHGVLFDLNGHQRSRLDRFEGPGYDARVVSVDTSTGGRAAFVYVAKSAFIEPDLRPFGWYKAHVVNGSLEHGLPAWYRDWLRSVPVIAEGGGERAPGSGVRNAVGSGKSASGR